MPKQSTTSRSSSGPKWRGWTDFLCQLCKWRGQHFFWISIILSSIFERDLFIRYLSWGPVTQKSVRSGWIVYAPVPTGTTWWGVIYSNSTNIPTKEGRTKNQHFFPSIIDVIFSLTSGWPDNKGQCSSTGSRKGKAFDSSRSEKPHCRWRT